MFGDFINMIKIELKKFGEMLISRPAGREAYLAMLAYILKDVDKEEIPFKFGLNN